MILEAGMEPERANMALDISAGDPVNTRNLECWADAAGGQNLRKVGSVTAGAGI